MGTNAGAEGTKRTATSNQKEILHCDSVQGIQSIIDEAGGNVDAAVARLAHTYRNIQICAQMTSIGKQAAERSGFPLGISRPNFGASAGLNTTTPLAEGETHECKIWTKTSIPGKMDIYRGDSAVTSIQQDELLGGGNHCFRRRQKASRWC